MIWQGTTQYDPSKLGEYCWTWTRWSDMINVQHVIRDSIFDLWLHRMLTSDMMYWFLIWQGKDDSILSDDYDMPKLDPAHWENYPTVEDLNMAD